MKIPASCKKISCGIDRDVYTNKYSKFVYKTTKRPFVNWVEWLISTASKNTNVEKILCRVGSKSEDFKTIRQVKASTEFFVNHYGFEESISKKLENYLKIKGGPNITDLHFGNLGIYNKNVVIIDYSALSGKSQDSLMKLFYTIGHPSYKKLLNKEIERIHSEFQKKPTITMQVTSDAILEFSIGKEKIYYQLTPVEDYNLIGLHV